MAIVVLLQHNILCNCISRVLSISPTFLLVLFLSFFPFSIFRNRPPAEFQKPIKGNPKMTEILSLIGFIEEGTIGKIL